MRMLVVLLAACCLSFVGAAPATQQVLPFDEMRAELTGPVSLQKELPLTLTLYSKSDGERRNYTNYSFKFVVLDEDGKQFGGPNVFIREAIFVKLNLDGKEATYKPRLLFYRDKEGIVPGRKYQLICVMPDCDLGAAVWFTLAR
jgi:hypothetical protein